MSNYVTYYDDEQHTTTPTRWHMSSNAQYIKLSRDVKQKDKLAEVTELIAHIPFNVLHYAYWADMTEPSLFITPTTTPINCPCCQMNIDGVEWRSYGNEGNRALHYTDENLGTASIILMSLDATYFGVRMSDTNNPDGHLDSSGIEDSTTQLVALIPRIAISKLFGYYKSNPGNKIKKLFQTLRFFFMK